MTARQRGWLLPPAAFCAACGVLAGRLTASVLPGLCAVLFAALACVLLRGRLRFAACLALAAGLGCLSASLAFHPVLPEDGFCDVTGVVSDEISSGARTQFRTALSDVTLDSRRFPAGVYWTFYADELPQDLCPGRFVRFRAQLYHPSGADNPDGYDFRETLLRRGITAGVSGMDGLQVGEPGFFSFQGAAAALRRRIFLALNEALGQEAGGYAAALLLGIRSGIPSDDRAAFSQLGIAHILSISGFHVGVLAGVLLLLFRLLRLPQKLRLFLLGLFLLGYAALCGMSQPVLRASVLALLTLEGRVLNRPRSGLHLWSATFLVLLLLSPVQLTGASFQMSFGATLGIVWLAPFFRSLRIPGPPSVRRAAETFGFILSAQLGVLLPQLYHYQSLPLLGLFTNIPVSLLSTAWILMCWAVLLFLPLPAVAALVGKPLAAFTSLLLSVIRSLGSLPGITLWTRASNLLTLAGFALLLAALCPFVRFRLRVRLPLLALALVLAVWSLFPQPHGTTEYIQFSAGNADAAVLWDQDTVIVVDTGNAGSALSGFLRRRRLTPDAVILTHLHADHAGGLLNLAQDQIPVSLICLPEGAESADVHPDMLELLDRFRRCGTEIRHLARNDVLPLPSGSATVLWPERGRVRPGQDANFSCLVTLFRLHGVSFLQASDLDGRYELYAARTADLLKIAHHGSAASTSPALLDAVAPRAALLTCAWEDRHRAVAERLGGVPLYSTARGGALTVSFGEGCFRIQPYLNAAEE